MGEKGEIGKKGQKGDSGKNCKCNLQVSMGKQLS